MMQRTPSKEDLQDLKIAEQMRDLIASPGWKVYERILQGHIDKKIQDLCTPLIPGLGGDGITHVLVGESAKGAVMGLRLALTLPSGIVAGAEQIRRKFNPSDAEVDT